MGLGWDEGFVREGNGFAGYIIEALPRIKQKLSSTN